MEQDEIRLEDTPPIEVVCSRRVAFVRQGSSAFAAASTQMKDANRVLTIESFCPTFALYTVVNLHGRFKPALSNNRFLPLADTPACQREESNKHDQNDPPRQARKRRARDKSQYLRPAGEDDTSAFRSTRLCQPPDAQSWFSFCQGGNARSSHAAASFWPKQVVLQHPKDILNDSAMRALLECLSRNDANAAGALPKQQEYDDNRDNTQLAVRPVSADLSTNTSPPPIHPARALPSHSRLRYPQDDSNAQLFTHRQQYTVDVEAYVYQKQRQRYTTGSPGTALTGLSDFKQPYLSLLHRFCINWAKLHFMEPRVFSKGGSLPE